MLRPPSLEAIEVIRSCSWFDLHLTLPARRLTKPLYAEVKRVLTALGAEWSTPQQAFVFDYRFAEKLSAVLDGRENLPARNPSAFFPTPPNLAATVLELSTGLKALPQGARILEPSAGRGALIDAALAIRPDLKFETCENDSFHREYLTARGISVIGEDFMDLSEIREPFAGVIMNPPFALEADKFAWLSHIEKAIRLLAPGGVLIAILPEAAANRATARIADWRKRVEALGGVFVENPKDAFKESGTLVKTFTLYLGGAATPAPKAKRADEACLRSPEEILSEIERDLKSTIDIMAEVGRIIDGTDEETKAIASRVSEVTPSKHPDALLTEINSQRQTSGSYSPAILPGIRTLSDLFSSVRVSSEDDRNDVHIDAFCSTPAECFLRGVVRPEIMDEIDRHLVVHDGYVKLITHDDEGGWTRVYWYNDRIIGSRFLGVVETRSIQPFAQSAAPSVSAAA